jgi:hypothetical protein
LRRIQTDEPALVGKRYSSQHRHIGHRVGVRTLPNAVSIPPVLIVQR